MRSKSRYYKHNQYWTCPYCGANLDAGERCTCRDEENTDPVRVFERGSATDPEQYGAAQYITKRVYDGKHRDKIRI